jgi:holo-[acyl-carrier protein] synthase
MIVGTGVDITEISRVQRLLDTYGEQFEQKVFTEEEIWYCRRFKHNQAEHYAVRFAAKEAFSKAIGTGIRMGFRWQEVGVSRRMGGPPRIVLAGRMAERYGDLTIHLSLSHSGDVAIAMVIAER